MPTSRYLCAIKIATFLSILSTTYACAADTANCSTPQILNKISNDIKAIADYQFQSHVTLDGNQVSSDISGKPPNHMRINMTIAQGNTSVRLSTTFDGTHQWIETKHPSAIEVSKIKLADLVSPDRPFDTSYYMMGSGLLNGEDYPASVLTLISIYDVSASCIKTDIELSGALNIGNFTNYVKTKRSTGSTEARVKQYSEKFGQIKMRFDDKTLALKEYSLGTKENPQSFTAKFSDFKFDQGLNEDAFTYTPPQGIQATDITKDLLEHLQNL